MSAVSTKPRAKSAKNAAPQPTSPSTVIGEICELIDRVEGLLTAAGRIGGQMDLGGRLIAIAEEDLIARFYEALKPEAFSEATVHSARDILFDVQAVLHGVEAMHSGDGRGVLMEQAITLADQVDDLMNPIGFWPHEPQISQRHSAEPPVQPEAVQPQVVRTAQTQQETVATPARASCLEAADELDSAQLYSQTLLFLLRCVELDELEHPSLDVNDPQSKTQCSLVLVDALADQQARAAKAATMLWDRSNA